ncbi:MAG: class I SAM-dependent methyltransferase [bacterium]
MICPVCSGGSEKYLDYRQIGQGNYVLCRCKKCHFLFTENLPSEEQLGVYYQKYDSTGSRDNYYRDLPQYASTKYGQQLVKLFFNLAKKYQWVKGDRMLDLGSGGGMFLDILKKSGYQEIGLEISREAVEFSIKQFGVKALAADVLHDIWPVEKFKAVFMWDLFEHVSDQNKLLEKSRIALVDNGYLIIETPNSCALINLIILGLLKLKISWPASWMFGIHHLFIHSEQSLKNILAQHGFRVLEVKSQNTGAERIFPWSIKYFIPRLVLELINLLSVALKRYNKLIIIAQKQ